MNIKIKKNNKIQFFIPTKRMATNYPVLILNNNWISSEKLKKIESKLNNCCTHAKSRNGWKNYLFSYKNYYFSLWMTPRLDLYCSTQCDSKTIKTLKKVFNV